MNTVLKLNIDQVNQPFFDIFVILIKALFIKCFANSPNVFSLYSGGKKTMILNTNLMKRALFSLAALLVFLNSGVAQGRVLTPEDVIKLFKHDGITVTEVAKSGQAACWGPQDRLFCDLGSSGPGMTATYTLSISYDANLTLDEINQLRDATDGLRVTYPTNILLLTTNNPSEGSTYLVGDLALNLFMGKSWYRNNGNYERRFALGGTFFHAQFRADQLPRDQFCHIHTIGGTMAVQPFAIKFKGKVVYQNGAAFGADVRKVGLGDCPGM